MQYEKLKSSNFEEEKKIVQTILIIGAFTSKRAKCAENEAEQSWSWSQYCQRHSSFAQQVLGPELP